MKVHLLDPHTRDCISLIIQELQALPCYPSEILPLFLYLGDRRHAYNASLNYELKIRAHLSLGSEMYHAFPEGITELHFDVEDHSGQNLVSKFEEIFKFLGKFLIPLYVILSIP